MPVVQQACHIFAHRFAVVTKENGERQKHAARMINANESRLRDHAQRTLSTIIRMCAPTNVSEQAGRITQALFFFRFFNTLFAKNLIRPVTQL